MSLAAQGATHIRVRRRIAADPASTALLLAGPAAVELWPGVHRVGYSDDRVLVDAPSAVHPREVRVQVRPPQRTPISFLTRFGFCGPMLPDTTGELALGYAPGEGGPSTAAVLTLDSEGIDASVLTAATLRQMAAGFLANLACAAESRNRAA